MVTQKECPLWIEILGNDPQTNATISQNVCADAITPLLIIQGNQLQGQTTASVDKVAKEVENHRNESATLGAIAVQRSREAIKDVIENSVQSLHYADAPKLIEQRS